MSPGVTFCHATDRIEEAVRVMEKHKIRRLPVIDARNKIIGMLSIGDVSHSGGKPLTDQLMKSVSEHHA